MMKKNVLSQEHQRNLLLAEEHQTRIGGRTK